MKNNHYYIYILECKNGKYYTGYSIDVAKRYALHVKGKGAKFTKINKPLKIAQLWKLRCTVGDAMKIEAFIKRKNRKFKGELVNNPAVLKQAILKNIELKVKFLRANFDLTKNSN